MKAATEAITTVVTVALKPYPTQPVNDNDFLALDDKTPNSTELSSESEDNKGTSPVMVFLIVCVVVGVLSILGFMVYTRTPSFMWGEEEGSWPKNTKDGPVSFMKMVPSDENSMQIH